MPGTTDLVNLGGWFANPNAQVSSHVATDGDGNSARYVADGDKAWHCGNFNSVSLGIEQVGFASQKTWPAAQLAETARWVAYWSDKYDIPLTRSTSNGVCTHKDLGQAGGGHIDPGSGYSVARVLELAKKIKSGKTSTTAQLTDAEEEQIELLERKRKIAKRNGGWSKIDKSHNVAAEKAKAWLEARLKAIPGSKPSSRPARRAAIRKVINNS